jgi:hypothetical protein
MKNILLEGKKKVGEGGQNFQIKGILWKIKQRLSSMPLKRN